MYNKNNFKLMYNDKSNAWATDTIAPAGMHILCIALRCYKPNKSEKHKIPYLLCFLNNKTRASVFIPRISIF